MEFHLIEGNFQHTLEAIPLDPGEGCVAQSLKM